MNAEETLAAANVAAAEAELARAKAAQAAARRPELIANLKVVRKELRTLRPKFEKLKADVMNLQAEHDNILRAIAWREDGVSTMLASKPACADVLPDDAEVVQWAAALGEKRTEIAQLRSALAAQPDLYGLRLSGVELAQRIQSLQYSESSLLNALSGTSGKSWAGKQVETGGVLSGVL